MNAPFSIALPLALPLALTFACTTADPGDDAPSSDDTIGGKADDPGQSSPNADEPLAALACWDGTFAYNTITLAQFDDTTDVRLSGAQLDIAEHLEADADFPWHPADVTFSLPTDRCFVSSSDGRLISCNENDVEVTITPQLSSGPPAVTAPISVDMHSTHVVRTHADGSQTRGVELEVRTYTREHRGHFVVRFGDQIATYPQAGCSLEPGAIVP